MRDMDSERRQPPGKPELRIATEKIRGMMSAPESSSIVFRHATSPNRVVRVTHLFAHVGDDLPRLVFFHQEAHVLGKNVLRVGEASLVAGFHGRSLRS